MIPVALYASTARPMVPLSGTLRPMIGPLPPLKGETRIEARGSSSSGRRDPPRRTPHWKGERYIHPPNDGELNRRIFLNTVVAN